MPSGNDPTRSYDLFIRSDLLRLQEIAARDREGFFERNRKYDDLRNHVVAVALCQGAALHFVDGRNGIKDIDVWTFYAPHPALRYPSRRPVRSYDFGDPRFGKTEDSPHFVGRRVDCLGRSLTRVLDDPAGTLRVYLSEARTSSARELARKAVVIIEPVDRLGCVVMPADCARPLGWREWH